jgi:hypothetical protein
VHTSGSAGCCECSPEFKKRKRSFPVQLHFPSLPLRVRLPLFKYRSLHHCRPSGECEEANQQPVP